MKQLPFLKKKTKKLSDKIVIVTATRGSGTQLLTEKPLGLFLEKSGWDKKTHIHEFNQDGLSSIYNRYLQEEFKDKYVIFVHDDVLITDLFFEEKVNCAFEKYDVIGLAGSKTCDINSTTPAWHLMTTKENMVGEVAHYSNGKVWTTCFGETDSRALVLDGLFVGVNVNVALEKGLKFNENFTFHHYDIDFSLSANNLKIKSGVFPLSVIHFGLGDSMNTADWQKSSITFQNLYKN